MAKEIKSIGLSKEQEQIAINLLNGGGDETHTLTRVYDDILQVWAEDNYLDEGTEFYKECLEKGAEVYTLKEDWQELGEIAVFNN